MATSFAVMCNALVGIELASTMGDEIRDPQRDLGPAIAIAGAVSIGSYLLVTGAVLLLVPVDQLGVIQGIMQAVGAGAQRGAYRLDRRAAGAGHGHCDRRRGLGVVRRLVADPVCGRPDQRLASRRWAACTRAFIRRTSR